jgi:hypothetical protein
MTNQDNLSGFARDWRAFLERNSEASIIVKDLMLRTGLMEDQVLFYLIAEWVKINSAIDTGAADGRNGASQFVCPHARC